MKKQSFLCSIMCLIKRRHSKWPYRRTVSWLISVYVFLPICYYSVLWSVLHIWFPLLHFNLLFALWSRLCHYILVTTKIICVFTVNMDKEKWDIKHLEVVTSAVFGFWKYKFQVNTDCSHPSHRPGIYRLLTSACLLFIVWVRVSKGCRWTLDCDLWESRPLFLFII